MMDHTGWPHDRFKCIHTRKGGTHTQTHTHILAYVDLSEPAIRPVTYSTGFLVCLFTKLHMDDQLRASTGGAGTND